MTTPKLNWKSGPPKQGIGWYVASYANDPKCLRWFSGDWWSRSVRAEDSPEVAGRAAMEPASFQLDILHLPKNLNRKQT